MTLANIQRKLSREAQKKIHGGVNQGCGIVYFDRVGGAVRNFVWADDTNANGATRDEAIASSTANNNDPNSLYRTGWCCAGCAKYV
jgi:hypothetical protein